MTTIVTKPVTKEYEEAYERVFGPGSVKETYVDAVATDKCKVTFEVKRGA